MGISIQHSYTKQAVSNPWKKFIRWADQQEVNRLGWIAFSIIGHGCIFTNLTIAVILFTGNHFIFWWVAISSMMACLVVILAALRTRILLITLLLSVIADLLIIVLCLPYGLHMEAAYR